MPLRQRHFTLHELIHRATVVQTRQPVGQALLLRFGQVVQRDER